MLKKASIQNSIKYAVLAFCIFWLSFYMLQNEIPTDVGDGIMHFNISQGSWYQPELFLHHWGKPFFILISSPFAQFGFNGMVVFNNLTFLFTCLIGFKILDRFKVSVWLQLLFPLVLLVAHDVTNTIFGGLTEPLFNLAIVGSLYLLLNKQFFWFALVVSFMPFMRSEGQLPFVLALVLLVFNKEYKSIPFLFFGFFIYAIIGLFVYHDFLWYFTKSAYSMNNGIYGKGTWEHYLVSYKNYLGNPGLYIVLLGIVSLGVLFIKKRWQDIQVEFWFFAYGIFIGVVVLHSYFWATGQNGSLGLTRIATQGMPLFVLLHLYYISRIQIFNTVYARVVYLIFGTILIGTLLNTKVYPQKADPLERQIIATSKYLKTLNLKSEKVYYHHPLLGFSYGENPFSKKGNLVFFSFYNLNENLKNILKPGDFIVRDSHFGPMEANMQLNEFAEHPELVKVKEFISSEQLDDNLNETEGIIVYQYIPINKQIKVKNSINGIVSGAQITIEKNQEFTDLPLILKHYLTDTKVHVSLTARNEGFVLVYDFNNAEDYGSVPLATDRLIDNTFLFRASGPTKLYIWNPKKIKGEIDIQFIQLETNQLHPVVKL